MHTYAAITHVVHIQRHFDVYDVDTCEETIGSISTDALVAYRAICRGSQCANAFVSYTVPVSNELHRLSSTQPCVVVSLRLRGGALMCPFQFLLSCMCIDGDGVGQDDCNGIVRLGNIGTW